MARGVVGGPPVRVEGECAPALEPVRRAFEEGFRRHGELGASLCVVRDGRVELDLWGGFREPSRERPWQRDTLANVFSVTKGVVSLCLALLLERGELDPDAPVAAAWPEFAAEGKQDVRVADLLAHRAGLAALRDRLPDDTHVDFARMTEALAAARPWWPPGRRFGYHALTWGWLAGELLRRLDGRTPGRFLREEWAAPRGLDLHLGAGPELDPRIAPIARGRDRIEPRVFLHWARTPLWMPMRFRVMDNPRQVAAGLDTRRWRAAEIPATNLQADARSLALLFGATVQRRDPLLRPETVARVTEPRVEARDLVFGYRNRMGLGLMRDGGDLPLGSGGHAFGHSGAGGALAFADPVRRLGFAYVPNRHHPSRGLSTRPSLALAQALYRAL